MNVLYIQNECKVKSILKVFERMRKIDPILERIRLTVGAKTDKEMCEKVELLNYATLDTWKTRDKIPSTKLRIISHSYGLNPAWLEFGEGEMYVQKSGVSQSANGHGNVQISGSKNKVGGIASEQREEGGSDKMVEIPYYRDVNASAGGGAVLPSSVENGVMKFSASFLHEYLRIDNYKGIHIINATGDSMEPTIVPGELLFVNPYENEDSKIKDGSIYVIVCSDTVLVKRVRMNPITKEMRLISDNRTIDDILVQGDDLDGCKIVGRVVGHFDKL